MKLKHLLISAFLLLSAGTAWADVTINETNFPDANFRGYLLSRSYGSDGVLTDAEIAEVTVMTVSYKNIQSLQGIEYFTALASLSCDINQLTSLDVSKNTALTTLYCPGNKLTSLDVSGCTALRELYCYTNQLTSLDVSGFTALRTLNCNNNQLTSLDVSGCTALWEFECKDNQLTSLDVSGCTALGRLECYSNQLTSLDVSKNTALTRLKCYSNQLTSLDVSGCKRLRTITCSGNQLTSLDVSGCTALEVLDCDYNALTSLDVSKNTELGTLVCYNNQLTSIDISGCSVLTGLKCYHNQLTSLDVSKNAALTTLECYQNQINGAAMDALVASLPTVGGGKMSVVYNKDEQNEITTTHVAAARDKGWVMYYDSGSSWNAYPDSEPVVIKGVEVNETNFPDEKFRNWILSQSYGSDALLTGDEIALARSINVSGRSIRSLQGIGLFTALTTLQCYNNQLTSLDVSKNTALTTLSCSENQLTSLDVSKNTALRTLYCYGNQLTSLDLSKNTALTSLYCYQNKIKGADMDALVSSLPTVSSGTMRVIYNENEQNVMTTTQVAVTKAKGWTPCYYNGNWWYEYPGVDPATSVNAIDADAADSAPWYTISGVQLTGKPTAPGIYIHNGKKTVVK